MKAPTAKQRALLEHVREGHVRTLERVSIRRGTFTARWSPAIVVDGVMVATVRRSALWSLQDHGWVEGYAITVAGLAALEAP